jgi:hypothetical protein
LPTWEEFQAGKKTINNPVIDKEIKQFVQSTKQTKDFKEFESQIKKLDTVRNENFWATFPELQQLKDYDPNLTLFEMKTFGQDS